MKLTVLARGVLAHYRKWWALYLVVGSGILWFGQNYKVVFNVTDSLPGRVYLIVKGEMPTKNDEPVAFRWVDAQKQTQFPSGVTFLKLAAGLPGDNVIQRQDGVSVGHWTLQPKEFSKKGMRLQANRFAGEIPTGHYFMVGTHKDSLDSRYEMVGLIPAHRIVGRAYEIF